MVDLYVDASKVPAAVKRISVFKKILPHVEDKHKEFYDQKDLWPALLREKYKTLERAQQREAAEARRKNKNNSSAVDL